MNKGYKIIKLCCEWCGEEATIHSGYEALCNNCWEGYKLDQRVKVPKGGIKLKDL